MTRSRIYWFAGAAALLFLAVFYLFDGGDPTIPASGVTLRMGATPAALPGQETAAPSSEVQHLINSGQFAAPPGNPDKMYSIASPFAAATPAAAAAIAAGNPGSPASIQPGLTMLGASSGSAATTQVATKNSPAAAVPAPPQPHSQPIEFETPPGIGSAKGGQ